MRNQNDKNNSNISHSMKNIGNMMNFAAKFNYKFTSNLNLPSDLNEKYTTKFYICENLS